MASSEAIFLADIPAKGFFYSSARLGCGRDLGKRSRSKASVLSSIEIGKLPADCGGLVVTVVDVVAATGNDMFINKPSA